MSSSITRATPNAHFFPIPEVPRLSNNCRRITLLSHPLPWHPIFSRERAQPLFFPSTNLDIAGNERFDVLNCWSDGSFVCWRYVSGWGFGGIGEGLPVLIACVDKSYVRTSFISRLHTTMSDVNARFRFLTISRRPYLGRCAEETLRDVRNCLVLEIDAGTRLYFTTCCGSLVDDIVQLL